MTIEWITSWWNLIFVLPFGLGLMYLGLYTVSGWTFGDADGASGLEHDLHVDAEADVDADADADADHGTDSGSNGSSRDISHVPFVLSVLTWIGLGKAPISLVLMILMMSWGAIGFIAIQVGRSLPVLQDTAVAIAVAGVGSSMITHVISAALGRLLFNDEGGPLGRSELLGSIAETMYPVDAKFGMACGRDPRGEVFQVTCRVGEGREPLAKGVKVKLSAYNAEDRMFYVVPVQTEELVAGAPGGHP